MRLRHLVPLLFVCSCVSAQTKSTPALPTIASKTAGMSAMPGYFPLYWEAGTGKLWLEIGAVGQEFLYVVSLPAGLGSNDIGLDRGKSAGEHVVRFDRSGNKVLLVEPNYGFRATTTNPDEKRSVRESFAESVLWGFTIEAEQEGRVLVDATNFFLRDAVDVVGALRDTKQGSFHPDATRSAIYLPRTKSFPKNTEVEATITVTGEQPGRFVREVTPTPEAITVREHQSFVELPGPGYEPRVFDPRFGYFGTSFYDFSAPLGEPVIKHYIIRHRVTKEKPLIYYLDRGVPEPIRSALLEGARWWSQAFADAGYPGVFRVELLPEDADPMDVRYHLIQWVHRSTRGWSYGGAVADPRTGEIIKAQVTLGSLRGRQDYMIAEALLAPYGSGNTVSPEMERMVLARLRQLAAHEVGHSLGLAHNYVASVAKRASVMDYPHPLITLDSTGAPTLTDAYAVGIGEWDKIAIRWGYGSEPAEKIFSDANQKGLYFITDADSRPFGSAHPFAHLWDNGTNAVDELNRILQVRARVLERFGERCIRPGAPMATIEEALVPAYLLHRYQTEAAAKVLGGVDYRYALRGDGQITTQAIPGTEQRRALKALLATLDPKALTLSEPLLKMIPPRPPEYPRTRENFTGHTGLPFDAMGGVESAASLTTSLLLNPERAARLIQYHSRDASQPDFREVVDALIAATWTSPRRAGLQGQSQRVIEDVVLARLLNLAADESAAAAVRAVAYERALHLGRLLTPVADSAESAHRALAVALIHNLASEQHPLPLPKPVEPPPGQPIGENY